MTLDGLIEKRAQQVLAEVCVGLTHSLQITRREQVKDEPVVALTEDLPADAARLLRDQHCSEVVLTALLDPCDVRSFPRASRTPQNALGLFDDGNCWNGLGFGLRKLVLIGVEDLLQDDSGQDEGGRSPELRYIDDAEFPCAERRDQHIEHLTTAIV